MKIALGCDHGGYAMKEDIKKQLEGLGHEVKDCGTYSTESCDYPIFGEAAARAVASGECEYGIVVCTTGIGISIAANKVKGIRCAHCADTLEGNTLRSAPDFRPPHNTPGRFSSQRHRLQRRCENRY